MKKKLFYIILFGLLLASCKEEKIQQGEIGYEISYPYTKLSGIMDVILPKKMTVIFKGDQMIATIEKAKIFRTDIISNATSQELKMRLDFGSENIEAKLSQNDLIMLKKTQPSFTAGKAIRTDTIAGLEATFYLVTSPNKNVGEFECAFSNSLSISETDWFTSYEGSKGIPLIYVIERYGIIMHLKATKFRSREVYDDEFNTKEPFKNTTYANYEKKVNELFELIIEE